MAVHKNAPKTPVQDENNRAVAFVNWTLPTRDGKGIKASKGFAIFQNPKYPNRHEDMLVELARKHGGSVEVNLKCRVMINNSQDLSTLNLDDIEILPPVPEAVPAQ